MRKTVLKTIESNDTVSLYSICFDGSDESEYEKFLKIAKIRQTPQKRTEKRQNYH